MDLTHAATEEAVFTQKKSILPLNYLQSLVFLSKLEN